MSEPSGAIGKIGTTEPAGRLLVLAGAVLWGTTGTALAFAPPAADPASVGAVRIAIGGVALLVIATLRGELRLRSQRWPPLAVAVAALGIACYQPFFFAAVSRTGVAVGTIIAIGSAPVATGLIGFFFGGERPGIRWGVATVLAIIGCGLLVGSGGNVHVAPAGVALALGAGVSYGVYATASKRILDHLPYAAVMAVVFGLGAALLSPVLFFSDLGWLFEPRGAAVALELGIVATALAYLLFARGLSAVPVATVATLSLAEPLTAGLLGVAVLGERLGFMALMGAGLLLGGLALVSVGRKRAESSAGA